MRLARNLLLAATAAIAAMAFMAGSAFGQAVEVVAEDGAHCGDPTEQAGHDTTGGCEISAVSVVPAATFDHEGLEEHQTSACENEFIANLDENGTGYIDVAANTIHTSPPPTFSPCPLVPCEEPATGTTPHADLEWPIIGVLEYGGEREELVVTFCVATVADAEGTGTPCTILVDLNQNHTTHVITLTAAQEPCHEDPLTELSGQWVTTGTSEVEILHPHYPGDFGA